MTRPRSPRYEQRKRAIIASAVHALNRKGVRGMTLADVAESLDLVPTGVIYYFKNKEELAEACFDLALARYREVIDAALEAETTRDRIAAFNELYFDFRRRVALREIDTIAVFNDVRALNRPTINDAYVDMFRAARALFDTEASRLSRLERNARAHLLLSEAFWAVVWLPRFDPEDFDRAATRVNAITTDGFATSGSVWAPVALPPLSAAQEGEDSAELFLRAATQLINEEGYIGASVEKISARLKLTKGAFYHHNQSKDELVVACFERTFKVMRQAIRHAEDASSSGYQALVTAATALVEHQIAGDAPLLRTSALTSAPEALQPELIGKFDRLSDRFASLISDGIADGTVRPVDSIIGAQLITAMINAAAELQYWAPGMRAGEAADIYVRPFFEGLLSPGMSRR